MPKITLGQRFQRLGVVVEGHARILGRSSRGQDTNGAPLANQATYKILISFGYHTQDSMMAGVIRSKWFQSRNSFAVGRQTRTVATLRTILRAVLEQEAKCS